MREALLRGWRRLEHIFDAAFGSACNPLRHLGALGFMFFWWLALSGIYLYAVLDTSAEGAWRSIDRLSREQWYLGGVLRSLHRYAADAFVIVMLLHLLREWLCGHCDRFRRHAWLTGVPLLVFAFVCAVGGFWLNWDQLGQFSAVATADTCATRLATPTIGEKKVRSGSPVASVRWVVTRQRTSVGKVTSSPEMTTGCRPS